MTGTIHVVRAPLLAFLIAFPACLMAVLPRGDTPVPWAAPSPAAPSSGIPEKTVRINGVAARVTVDVVESDPADVLAAARDRVEAEGAEVVSCSPDGFAARDRDGGMRFLTASPAGEGRTTLRTIRSEGVGSDASAAAPAACVDAGIPVPSWAAWDLCVEDETSGALMLLARSPRPAADVANACARSLAGRGWEVRTMLSGTEGREPALLAIRDGRSLRVTAEPEGDGSSVALWCVPVAGGGMETTGGERHEK